MEFLKNVCDRLGTVCRRKRIKAFEEFYVEKVERSDSPDGTKILDVGGTFRYWQQVRFKYFDTATLVLLNLTKAELPDGFENVSSVAGDATDLSEYADKEFDLAFSNSVIEHVGGVEAQKKMASEMKRVGKHYYLQTPNRYFFIEPHFLFPLFQFLPLKVKAFLIKRFQLGYMPKAKNDEEAAQIANSVHLLTKKELEELFPDAEIKREKFLFFTKSFYLYY